MFHQSFYGFEKMKKGSLGQNNEVLTDVRKNDFGKMKKKWNFVKKSHKCLTKNHIIIDKKNLIKMTYRMSRWWNGLFSQKG